MPNRQQQQQPGGRRSRRDQRAAASARMSAATSAQVQAQVPPVSLVPANQADLKIRPQPEGQEDNRKSKPSAILMPQPLEEDSVRDDDLEEPSEVFLFFYVLTLFPEDFNLQNKKQLNILKNRFTKKNLNRKEKFSLTQHKVVCNKLTFKTSLKFVFFNSYNFRAKMNQFFSESSANL